MAQQFRVCTALAEEDWLQEQSSSGCSQAPVTPVPGGLLASIDTRTSKYIFTPTDKHTHVMFANSSLVKSLSIL